MNLGLENKVALVIASSQGLGKAVAEQLIIEGAKVMITSRNEEKLKATYQELGYNNGRLKYYPADITNLDDIKSLVKYTKQKLGKIDILINNAGGPPSGTFESLTDKDWESAFQLNLLSYVRVIREVLPDLKEEGGRIINIVSSSIKEPIPGLLLSNSLRLGVLGLAKTLSNELAPYNILVNNVAPGRIATERVASLDQIKAEKEGSTVEEVENKSKNSISLKRYGTPEEFANAVVFLASEASSYITGSSILVDGGKIKSI